MGAGAPSTFPVPVLYMARMVFNVQQKSPVMFNQFLKGLKPKRPLLSRSAWLNQGELPKREGWTGSASHPARPGSCCHSEEWQEGAAGFMQEPQKLFLPQAKELLV